MFLGLKDRLDVFRFDPSYRTNISYDHEPATSALKSFIMNFRESRLET